MIEVLERGDTMNIATILFTYNRSWHTKQVLDALSENTVLPQKLFIFQDGMKENTDREEWEKVGEIIKSVTWCDVELRIEHENRGLADSVIDGLNYVFEQFDAVIVLEDDCVPHPLFMNYMISALNKYYEHSKVYSVSGYAWSVDLQNDKEDAYFNGRISSWGWGTWKNRWKQYERDFFILKRIKNNKEGNVRLQLWGPDLENMLLGNITGKCDSWAVFWALKVIEEDGICLSPYESLITNIGLDGSGTHSGKGNILTKHRYRDNINELILPDKIEITEECKDEFLYYFSSATTERLMQSYKGILVRWLNWKQNGQRLREIDEKEIAVWGRGAICDLFLQENNILEKVSCIVESRPQSKLYKEIPVVGLEELPKTVKLIIVIPIYDIKMIYKKVKKFDNEIKVIGIDELLEEVQ